MSLATATSAGCPTLRTVLLAFDSRGFVFFTISKPQGATDLQTRVWFAVPRLALQRQVSVNGLAEKLGRGVLAYGDAPLRKPTGGLGFAAKQSHLDAGVLK